MKGKEPNREPEPIPQEPLEPQCRFSLGTANRELAEPNRTDCYYYYCYYCYYCYCYYYYYDYCYWY